MALQLPPDRVAELITKIESGQVVTPEDIRRTETLVALDVAKFGRDYLAHVVQNDVEMTERLSAVLEAS